MRPNHEACITNSTSNQSALCGQRSQSANSQNCLTGGTGVQSESQQLDQEDERAKLFVGGLSWETTQENLQKYFQRFGQVTDCVVMKNNETGRSRGFGFVSFTDSSTVSSVLRSGSHTLDGRTIDPKPCNPKTLQKPRYEGFPKVFLGGLPPNITETDLRTFFAQHGKIMEVVIMYDQEKKKSRGFGFLSFLDENSVEKLLSQHFVTLNGKQVEVKRASPRDSGNFENSRNKINQAPNLSSSNSTKLIQHARPSSNNKQLQNNENTDTNQTKNFSLTDLEHHSQYQTQYDLNNQQNPQQQNSQQQKLLDKNYYNIGLVGNLEQNNHSSANSAYLQPTGRPNLNNVQQNRQSGGVGSQLTNVTNCPINIQQMTSFQTHNCQNYQNYHQWNQAAGGGGGPQVPPQHSNYGYVPGSNPSTGNPRQPGSFPSGWTGQLGPHQQAPSTPHQWNSYAIPAAVQLQQNTPNYQGYGHNGNGSAGNWNSWNVSQNSNTTGGTGELFSRSHTGSGPPGSSTNCSPPSFNVSNAPSGVGPNPLATSNPGGLKKKTDYYGSGGNYGSCLTETAQQFQKLKPQNQINNSYISGTRSIAYGSENLSQHTGPHQQQIGFTQLQGKRNSHRTEVIGIGLKFSMINL